MGPETYTGHRRGRRRASPPVRRVALLLRRLRATSGPRRTTRRVPRGRRTSGGTSPEAAARSSAACAAKSCPQLARPLCGRTSTGRPTTSSASPPPSSRTSPRSPWRGASRSATPSCVIVFGGANFDGEMGEEYVRAIPVDRLRGRRARATVAFPALLAPHRRAATTRRRARRATARADRAQDRRAAPHAATSTHFPIPDYDEYFASADAARRTGRSWATRSVQLLVEFSRGCWWGAEAPLHLLRPQRARHGLPLQVGPGRVQPSSNACCARTRSPSVEAVDNILDMKLPDDALQPDLADAATGTSTSSTRSRRT